MTEAETVVMCRGNITRQDFVSWNGSVVHISTLLATFYFSQLSLYSCHRRGALNFTQCFTLSFMIDS